LFAKPMAGDVSRTFLDNARGSVSLGESQHLPATLCL
jgi:hypothetical protein